MIFILHYFQHVIFASKVRFLFRFGDIGDRARRTAFTISARSKSITMTRLVTSFQSKFGMRISRCKIPALWTALTAQTKSDVHLCPSVSVDVLLPSRRPDESTGDGGGIGALLTVYSGSAIAVIHMLQTLTCSRPTPLSLRLWQSWIEEGSHGTGDIVTEAFENLYDRDLFLMLCQW